jgi:hypothetical protein
VANRIINEVRGINRVVYDVSSKEALAALGLKPAALAAAITRSIPKRRLAKPRHGFYRTVWDEAARTAAATQEP